MKLVPTIYFLIPIIRPFYYSEI